MMLWKCCTQYASKFGKFSSGHRTGKCQCSFQSLRRAMPKNVQATTQLHSFHILGKVMLKILQARLQQNVVHELQDVHVGFRKARETRDQIASICWIIGKARQFQKISISASLTMPKSLCGSQRNCGKFLNKGNTRSSYLLPEKSICRSRSNS